jgi:ABC-type phosphate transport system auxiliary subunit
MDNTLHKYKDKPFYEVPEDFFEQFQQDVMQRVAHEAKRQKKQRQWISVVSVAASIALIMVLSYFIFLNKDGEQHFYVHEDLLQSENLTTTLDTNCLAEATEHIHTNTAAINPTQEIAPSPKSLPHKTQAVETETIAYRAVDYYVDDVQTEAYYETMYELECYYDY